MIQKMKAAIVGPGNIGIDLMEKIRKHSQYLELCMMLGICETSSGIIRAKEYGVDTQINNMDALLCDNDIKIVFEATSASEHIKNAPKYKAAGKIVFDLTPAAVGPYVVPCVNLEEHLSESNINLITCGGQATTPIVAAVSAVQEVEYAEIVSTISSKSAGPGTRANIDEFTQTTARALCQIGKAKAAKAIIILNPAEPPLMMRNTIYCVTQNQANIEQITRSVLEMVERVRCYVPGYHLIMPPTLSDGKVVTMIEVSGSGDYLPEYAGNLDIITCAAVAMADKVAKKMMEGQLCNR